MNPVNWVRWKVVIALGVILGLFYTLGLDPLTRWQINSLGSKDTGARWSVAEVGLGLLAGDVEILDLLVSAARKLEKEAAAKGSDAGEEKVFNADEVRFELSVLELSKKRFVIDEMGLVNPRLEMRRREDGSTNIGDIEDSDIEDSDIERPRRETSDDWVRSAIEWYEKLQKVREKLPTGGGENETETERERQKELDLWQREVEYPFRDRPTWVVRRIHAEQLEVSFADEGDTDGELPNLTDGVIAITDLSSNPAVHEEPIRLTLAGNLAGAMLRLETTLDFTGATTRYRIELDSGGLPVSVVDAFIGDSLPVSLASGKIGVTATLALDDKKGIEIAPRLFFQSVKLARKPGEDRVAGLDAGSFVKAFNEASGALGEERLEIADLRITGTIDSPRFEWGDTVRNLVTRGGLAFANARIEKGKALARERLESGLRKFGEKLGPRADAALRKSGVGETFKSTVKGVLPSSEDGAEGAGRIIDSVGTKAGGFLRGLGGGKKKD